MGKTVRLEEIKLFDSFREAANDGAYKKIEIDVEDEAFPETVEHNGNLYRKVFIRNNKVYIKYDSSK